MDPFSAQASGHALGFPGTESTMKVPTGKPSRDLPPPVRARLFTEQVIRQLEERSQEFSDNTKERSELRKQRIHPDLRDKGREDADLATKWSMQEAMRLFERVKLKDEVLHSGAGTVPNTQEQRTMNV